MERLDKDRVVYNIEDFPYHHLMEYKRVRGHRGIGYIQVPAAFDIETTSYYCPYLKECPKMKKGKCPSSRKNKPKKKGCQHWIDPVAWLYQWQCCIGEDVVFGRTWEEYRQFLSNVQETLSLTENLRIVMYVHNLSYEFAFMQREFDFVEVFARQKRKSMKALDKEHGIEYRCSYIMTNLSLQKWTESAKGVVNKKEPESYDYNLIRFPDTPLTDEEKLYCYRDVKGLCEALEERYEEDNVTTIPITSTGYVRRDCRKAVKSNKKNIYDMRRWRLTPELYQMMKEELRGGDTHANYLYAGEILENLQTYDIASSYPFVAMSEKLPTKFIEESPSEFRKYEDNEDYGFIARFRFTNLRYVGKCKNPYISFSKTAVLDDETLEPDKRGRRTKVRTQLDNGRILACKDCMMTLNEIDYRIIREEYIWDEIYIKDFYVSKLKMLNRELRLEILKYFEGKCKLKHTDPYLYMKSKNKLNGIYGMMLTDIFAPEILYENHEWGEEEKDLSSALESYYYGYNSFLSYQHGIWIVSYARRNLRSGLWAVGADQVYCDTDSIKCLNDHAATFEEINRTIKEKIETLDIKPIIEYNGEMFYMGIWERDPDYKQFRTWGAKKYAVQYENGKYEITVAGLAKSYGTKVLEEEGLEAFQLGKTFFPSGRLQAFYNDQGGVYNIEGHEIHTKSFVAMVPGTYTLGITQEYDELIKSDPDFWMDIAFFL